MKPAGLCKMAVSDLAANKGRAAVSTGGIALGVAVLMIIAGLGLGARDVVLHEVVQELPVDIIEVLPKTLNVGILKLDAGSLLGESGLDEQALARLAALPGVKSAYPKLEVKLPLGAQGGLGLFRRRLYTDMFLTGLPPELVQPEVGDEFHDRPDVIPVIISDQLIELYNTAVAPSLGLPQLTGETLKGFEFELVVGRSLMLGARGATRSGIERARIVGVSRHALRLGATVPIETARRIMASYGEPGTKETYASILLRAETPANVPEITEGVHALGYSIDETAKRTGDILTAGTLLASLVGMLVLMLAALNIAHSFFASLSERRRELAILRATGARKIDLISLVLTQAAFLGAAGAVAGMLVAHVVALTIDWTAAVVLPSFPFKPDSFFSMPLSLHLLALLSAVVAAVLGALWPAVRAAREPVARALAQL